MSNDPSTGEEGDEAEVSRRAFLGLRWAPAPPQTREADQVDQPGPATRADRAPLSTAVRAAEISLGTIERLRSRDVGTVQKVSSGAAPVYAIRLPDGLLAVWGRCSGDDCFVTWRPRDRSEDQIALTGHFYCSCDASVFDRRGIITAGPAPRPLDVLTIRVDERGTVIAYASDLIQRDSGDTTTGVFSLGEAKEAP
jgi:hypothetical protein